MAPISPPPSPSVRHHHITALPSRLRKRDRLRPAVILFAVLSILWTGNRLRTAAAAGEGGMYAYPLRDGGVNSFVGGGAVIPHAAAGAGLGGELVEEGEKGGENQKKVGESVWGTHGVVGGWLFKPKEKEIAKTTTNETGGGGKKGGVLGSLWRGHVAVKEDKDDDGTVGSIAAVEPATPDAKDGGSSGEKTEYISPSLAEQFAQEKEMYLDASRVSHDSNDGDDARTPPLPVPVQAGLAVPAAGQDTTAPLPAPEHKQAFPDDDEAAALLPQKIPETALKPPVEAGPEPLPLPLPTPSRNDQLTTPATGLEPSTNPAAADQHATWEEGVGQADADANAHADANAAARVSDSKQQHHGGAMLGAMDMGSMGLSGGFRRS